MVLKLYDWRFAPTPRRVFEPWTPEREHEYQTWLKTDPSMRVLIDKFEGNLDLYSDDYRQTPAHEELVLQLLTTTDLFKTESKHIAD